MQNNFKQVITLLTLIGATSPVLAAPVVSQFNDYSPDRAAVNSSETEAQRQQRILDNKTDLQVRMQQQLSTQSQEISRLNGVIEEQNFKIDQLVERQRQLLIDVADIKDGSSSPKSVKTSSSSSKSSSSSTVVATPSPEQVSYQKARALMNSGKSNEAIKAFESYLSSYPNSTHAPKSYYLSGVLYFNNNQDADALKKFAESIKYKSAPDRPDSLFKMGEIAKRNNKPDAAAKYYNLVISEHPTSQVIPKAKAALASL